MIIVKTLHDISWTLERDCFFETMPIIFTWVQVLHFGCPLFPDSFKPLGVHFTSVAKMFQLIQYSIIFSSKRKMIHNNICRKYLHSWRRYIAQCSKSHV